MQSKDLSQLAPKTLSMTKEMAILDHWLIINLCHIKEFQSIKLDKMWKTIVMAYSLINLISCLIIRKRRRFKIILLTAIIINLGRIGSQSKISEEITGTKLSKLFHSQNNDDRSAIKTGI